MKAQSRFVVITGVSTGIGYGAAKELVRRGYTVFGSVRKQLDAEHLKVELGTSFLPLLFDVTDEAAVKRAALEVGEHIQGQGLAGLINNAGIGVSGPIELLSVDEIARNFDVNVFGVLRTTKAFLPLLGAQKDHPSAPGRILNISSMAGKFAAPYMGPYSGTKHALEALSIAMRLEFMRYGIKVVVIGPGFVRTPILDKESPQRFVGTEYYDSLRKTWDWGLAEMKKALPLQECSRKIGDIFETEQPKRRYVIARQRFVSWALPHLPQSLLDYVFTKMM